MLKKPMLLLGILGGLLLVIGIILNPELMGKVSSNGHSEWKAIKTHLFKYYLIIIGASLTIISITISKLKIENRKKHYLLGLSAMGIVITAMGLLFSPSFSVENFSPTNYLSNDGRDRLLYYQIISITLGCFLIFVPILLYSNKYLRSIKLSSFAIVLIGALLYLFLFKQTYVNSNYPSNIIFNPSEYKKVGELLLGQDILLSDFEPRSTLKVDRKKVVKAKFPVIDFNAHLSSSFRTEYDKKVLSPENLIKSMDSVGLQIVINTDVEDGDLDQVLNHYARKYPDRFMNLWPTGFGAGIMTDKRLAELPEELDKAIQMGAAGDGELWKNLGLKTKDITGKIISVDDPRLDPLWAKAGDLGVPILWHLGDPAAMFQPIDRFNERYQELRSFPEWSYYGSQFPRRETIMKGRENVLKKHPNTNIIGCHMGWNVDDLSYAGYLLDTYPNYYLDLSTTLSELGRQPYTTRKFFIKYQDRIVFGTDGGSLYGVKGWTVEKFYQAHWEFFETENEYIDYPMQGAINQGNWKIYGINLPDSVLQKIYYKNAEKLLNIKIDYNP